MIARHGPWMDGWMGCSNDTMFNTVLLAPVPTLRRTGVTDEDHNETETNCEDDICCIMSSAALQWRRGDKCVKDRTRHSTAQHSTVGDAESRSSSATTYHPSIFVVHPFCPEIAAYTWQPNTNPKDKRCVAVSSVGGRMS